jgi:hypothetical protein
MDFNSLVEGATAEAGQVAFNSLVETSNAALLRIAGKLLVQHMNDNPAVVLSGWTLVESRFAPIEWASLLNLSKELQPLFCVSAKFSPQAIKWAVIEKEAYGIYFSVKKLAYYLRGKRFMPVLLTQRNTRIPRILVLLQAAP